MNNRPGDWNCRSCFHLNFQRRESCQRCGNPKLAIAVDHYGGSNFIGIRNAAAAAVSSPFGFAIGPDVRPGDWYCAVGNCGAHNFASRSSCFKCGVFKLDVDSQSAGGGGGGFDNGGGRSAGIECFGFGSSSGAGNSSRSGWKSGDWICTRLGCNEHNFASRMECFRCNAPRDSTTMSSYF
ncbi:transcription initiation factor TFIID subunit 15b-like [Impatiens glandulifera]|uniref:transcription initiation factor TFIID subunit 15b-like n=1 Tax=Impatiens glandulifera TaxID=253017 RepID=UPI001FB0D884|nr:transcription initiation factor TFIID subunit 15b-like [Impatiens glandulifera]XP_047329177.1 transcription initiation factor TFIID subunit 15b-like [Impatiens glandulifera]